MTKREMTCCFTGHRTIDTSKEVIIKNILEEEVTNLIEKGVVYYGSGYCRGFDLIASSVIAKLKENNKIWLIAVIPCREQDKFWSYEDRQIYAELLKKADKTVILSERYYNGCMYARNRHLVNFSQYCICYKNKETGGTAYTVSYAQKSKLNIINIADSIV
ncbi:MAG: DUF1273 family protein [Firmicutes bacterium]|nr:DUF1273 family protein [Bacillota bacterium]